MNNVYKLVSLILSIVLSTSLLTACSFGKDKNDTEENFDYLESDLSDYVVLSNDAYKSIEYVNNYPSVNDFDVENEIVKVLCKNKITPDNPVVNLPNVTLGVGDIANIYYRGFLIEDGLKNYYDGGCNFNATIFSLEIGSGTFIPGFEYSLIGKNQKDYATMEKLSDGSVQLGDIINFTYSAYYSDGTAKMAQTATIDLGDPMTDEAWGKGFVEYFINNTPVIGEKFGTNEDSAKKIIVETTRESIDSATTDVYFDMTVSEVYRVSEGERLVVEAYFPIDYSYEELQGKTSYFEVYIKSAKDYIAPEFNDEFITNTLKLSADDLASYKGNTLTEKFKGYVKDYLIEEQNEMLDEKIESYFWEKVVEKATFKKLPKSEVDEKFNELVDEVVSAYESGYSWYYPSVDEFARAYLGLEAGVDWKDALRKDAEIAVKQKLIFYYVIREKDWIPKDDKYDDVYNEVFNEHVIEYLEYYSISENDADYASKLQAAQTAVKAQYTDEYWNEMVLYKFATPKVVSYFVTVISTC